MSAGSVTPIALVHGVGFGPSTFASVARELRRAGPVLVVERRGYGSRAALAPAARVEDHVADLCVQLDGAGVRRAVVAGCSGGATVALAAALLAPERIVAAVAHEPAVGSLAPELVEVVRTAVARGELPRVLAGPQTWQGLAAAQVAGLRARAALVAADARAFMTWEPPLDATSSPIVCTVGARSDPLRHEIAATLRDRTGARVVVLPDCGHLAQLDAPAAFARVIAAAGRTALAVAHTTREDD
jgi:pimeloyl-ACP methyl ester carboxylesterase